MQLEFPAYKPEPRYTPADWMAKLEGGSLSIVIDAQGNVTEVKRTSDPVVSQVDVEAALRRHLAR